MPEPQRPDWGEMNLWAALQRALGFVNQAEDKARANDSPVLLVPGNVVDLLQRARRELGEAALALSDSHHEDAR